MTGKEKIEAAFSKDGSPEFAAVIPYEGIYIRDNWDAITSRPWWCMHDPDIDRQLELHGLIADALGQDWFHVPGCRPREERKHMRVETSNGSAFLVNNLDGSRKELAPPVRSGWGSVVAETAYEELPTSEEEIDRRIVPVHNDPGPPVISDGRDDLAKAALCGYAKDLFPISHVNSPLWLLYSVWGFEGLMTMIAGRPELVKRACERVFSKVLRRAREGAALGARAIWIEECLTDQISPDAFAKLNAPFVAELVNEIHNLGLKAIYYFCGDPSGKWEHLLSVGADALSLEESKKGFEIDIMEVAGIVKGRCALLGNLDAIGILQNGSEDELRSAIEYQIKAGRANGGRFIMSLGSPVPPDVPPCRVHHYCDLTHELSGSIRS